jgi:mannose-1-phosphate guanylyltransferase
MKALLLAAGLGTRMKPLTFHKAKACLPLLNLPFIHYPLQYLYSHEISDVVINLHAHPESVRQAAKQFYRPLNIHFSMEPEILGTAGAIRKVFNPDLPEPLIVMNADMVMDIPLDAVIQQHFRQNADVTLVIMESDRFSQYGGIYFDQENDPESSLRFSGIHEGKGKKYHYTGLQIINPKMVEFIPTGRKSEVFSGTYLPLMDQKRICGFVYQDFWFEIGNLKEYLNTSLHLLQHPLPENLQPPGMKATLVSSEAILEETSEVSESIIMEGAKILSGVRVERSIIGWDVIVTESVQNVALARGILPWPIEAK